ncbi:hypothetical protein JL720_7474 [Aureococcus anophagefferens]|nr:hypothetical protein JL720_7474 [Aureococcus anophagefferens]
MSHNAKPDPRHNIAQPDGKQVAPSQTATQRSTAETLTGLKRKQRELQNEVYGDLQFMLHHFVQLQSSDHTSTQVNAGNQQRLASFINHLETTIEKLLAPAASEGDLDILEKHLRKTLLPVKKRLEAQLDQSRAKRDERASARRAAALPRRRRPWPLGAAGPRRRRAGASPPPAEPKAFVGGGYRGAQPVLSRAPRPDGGQMLIIDDEEDQAYGCIEYLENDDDDFFAGGGEPQRKRRRHAAVVTDTGSSSEPNRSSSEEDFGGRSDSSPPPRRVAAGLPPPSADLQLDDDFCPSTVQILPETVEYHCSITHPPPAEADDGAAPRDGARSPPRPAAAARRRRRRRGAPPRRARKRGGGGDDASTVSHAQGAALLELFGHARSCPGRHQSAVHARVCSNAKFIMLHARDCDAAPGTCDVEWCGAVKKLLKHVVRCQQGDKSLSGSLTKIVFGTDIFDKRAVSIPVSRYVRPRTCPACRCRRRPSATTSCSSSSRGRRRGWRRVGVGVAGDVAAYSRSLKLLGFGDAVESDTDYSSGVLRSIELVPVTAKSDAGPTSSRGPWTTAGARARATATPAAPCSYRTREAAAAPRRRQLDVAALRWLDDALVNPSSAALADFVRRGSRALGTPVDVPF